jgi:hypothetical protein
VAGDRWRGQPAQGRYCGRSLAASAAVWGAVDLLGCKPTDIACRLSANIARQLFVPALYLQIALDLIGPEAMHFPRRYLELHARAAPFPAAPLDFSFLADIDLVAVPREIAILKKTVLHGCSPPVDLVRRLLHAHSYQFVINARLNRY